MFYFRRYRQFLKRAKRICKRYLSYERYSFKFKLIFIYVFLSLLPISLIVFISYHFYSESIEKQISDLIEYSLIQTSENIKTKLGTYKDLIYTIVSDEDLNYLFSKFNNGNNVEKITALNSIRERFIIYTYPKWEIRSLAFINEKMESVAYEKTNPNISDTVWNDLERKKAVYQRGYSEDGIFLLPTSALNYQNRKKEQLFHMILKVKNLKTQEIIGVLVLSLQESVLSDICNPHSMPEWQNILRTYSFIIDQQGQIISCADKDYIGKNVNDYLKQDVSNSSNQYNKIKHIPFKFNGSAFIINKRAIDKTSWVIINLADKGTLFYQVNFFKRAVVLISIGIALVFTAIILIITKHYSGSIRRIVDGMKLAQSGQLSVQLELENKDEFFAIAERFNKMMRQIKHLVEEVKKQKEDVCRATYRQKEAEIRALEAQINPHFLYNTLDCINWLAIEKEEYEISQMLSKLAQILRYSINKSNSIVTLAEEINWLKQYIYIQQQRFNHSFECILDIDEEAKKFPIHKLLLQPFIENAIIHGFEGYRSGGILHITINIVEGHHAEFRIEDNGNGIEEETLSKIVCNINSNQEEAGIGIYNVINRVKMYYGNQAKLEIWSKLGEGTKILLKIPELGAVKK
ncbi:MAG: two-component system, sensor histidine kinase YesM [Epulopiscium sp.]|nr:two-component system, sensor histidine kinase YesM [Candidatus Epulonipiscium sp.]